MPTSATIVIFAVGILSWGLFVSVLVGCLMQVCFCDGWLQHVSDQDQEPGPFPPGIRTGGASRYVRLILPDVSSAQGTEPLNLPKPCPTYLALSLYHGVNTLVLHTKNTDQKKKAKSWCVISFYNSI